MAEESKRTVFAAMGANIAIAIGKLAAGILTGSGSLLAEAGHSFADTVNQVFLLIGINLSDALPDEHHPHGHGKEGFFWSFLAAIFIFVAGATFSFYEGARTLIQNDYHERSATDLSVGFGVLGMAFLFEGISLAVTVHSMVNSSRARHWSLGRYIRRSPDVTMKTVFFEDSAALIGLVLAALGLLVSELTSSEVWDGLAAIGIGGVLTFAALNLGYQSRQLLIGAAASDDTRQAIRAVVHEFPQVKYIVRLLTMQIGTHSVLVTGEIEVERGLTTNEIEELLAGIDRRIAQAVPEVKETFWELRPRPTEDSPPRPITEQITHADGH